MTRRGVFVVEDAEAKQHCTEPVTQPLPLVMLIGADLVQQKAESVLTLEEDSRGLGAEVDPGAEELQQSALGRDVGGGCVLKQADTLTHQGHGLGAGCRAQLDPEQVLPQLVRPEEHVGEGGGAQPVADRVRAEQAATEELARGDVHWLDLASW